MRIELVTKTEGVGNLKDKSIDEIIVAQARVSSSKSKSEIFNSPEKLIRYMLLNAHFSPFEMCFLGFEIETSRAISLELVRHKSFSFQQFSQRYSETEGWEIAEMRKQSENNRQSSTDAINSTEIDFIVNTSIVNSFSSYRKLLSLGAARESARFVLPEATTTRLYMNGSLRSWITFLNVRLHKTAQKEIRLLAEAIRDILIVQCPVISEALYDFDNAYDIPILDRMILEKYRVYDLALDKHE